MFHFLKDFFLNSIVFTVKQFCEVRQPSRDRRGWTWGKRSKV